MSQHIVPLRVYFAVFGALMVFTFITVWVAFIDLGVMNNVIMLTIACTKAVLVILYFMHVRYSSRLMRMFVAAGFVWLLLLLVFVLSDYMTRGGLTGQGL
ncbi:MAG: cytochrome C oxidase subunit IV family protein [candidate division KSB1 bacterium]